MRALSYLELFLCLFSSSPSTSSIFLYNIFFQSPFYLTPQLYFDLPMLLSARDRHADISNPLSQKPLPDILSTFRRPSIPSSIIQTTHSLQSTPRLALPSLDPLSAAQSIDNMSPASSSSSLSYPQQNHPNDSNTQQARYHIGRHIVDTRTADDEDTQNRNPIA